MFFLPILMSVSALIALLIPADMSFLPTFDMVSTTLIGADPIGNIVNLLHPPPYEWYTPASPPSPSSPPSPVLPFTSYDHGFASTAPVGTPCSSSLSYENGSATTAPVGTGSSATAPAGSPSPSATPASTCASRVGTFTEPSRLLEDIPFMDIPVEVVEEPRVSWSYKVSVEGWAEFVRSIVLRFLASSIVEEPWLFVNFYYAIAPLVPDAADPMDQAPQTSTLVVIDLEGVEQAIVSHLLRLWIFTWYIQSGDLGERRWIWVSDPAQMTMAVR